MNTRNKYLQQRLMTLHAKFYGLHVNLSISLRSLVIENAYRTKKKKGANTAPRNVTERVFHSNCRSLYFFCNLQFCIIGIFAVLQFCKFQWLYHFFFWYKHWNLQNCRSNFLKIAKKYYTNLFFHLQIEFYGWKTNFWNLK